MSIGSGLFSKARAAFAHLVHPGGGLAGEIYDLRKDLLAEFQPMAGFAVEEFTNPVGTAAGASNGLHAATATVAAPVTLLRASLVAAGLTQLALFPRKLVFTTAGATASDAPATVTITGLDQNGAAQTETLALAQTATTATSTKYWSDITQFDYPAADGTGATIAIGLAAAEIHAATATVTTATTLLASSLIQTDLARYPRQLVFTTAGGTAADAPANVVITGNDARGLQISETLNLAQTATTATSVNAYAYIKSLAFAAGDGTGATIQVTFAAPIGLHNKILARTGLISIIRELFNGAVVTNGTVTAASTIGPYGAYTPNTAPDGVNDYCIYYDYDASA